MRIDPTMGVMAGGDAEATASANRAAEIDADPNSAAIHSREMVATWPAAEELTPPARPAVLAAVPSCEGAEPEAGGGPALQEIAVALRNCVDCIEGMMVRDETPLVLPPAARAAQALLARFPRGL